MIVLVSLSDPPGEYRMEDEDDQAAQPTPRFFTLATPAALAQQLANTHLRPVRVVSRLEAIAEDGAVYEPQAPSERDKSVEGSPRIVPASIAE